MRDELNQSLQALEHELRNQGRWDDTPPAFAAMHSKQPFAADQLSFDQWLQWVLLPKLRDLLARQLPLPSDCAIHPMAEEFYGQTDPGGIEITRIVTGIDMLLTGSQGGLN